MSCISCSMCERISWVDGWRGLACWLMLVYHLMFDFYMFGWVGWDFIASLPMVIFEQFIAYSFILCAGISACLTRNGLRRGLITAGAGFLVMAGSFVVSAPILFGILQFLSIAMIFYALTEKWTGQLVERVHPLVWVALFALTKIWTTNTVAHNNWFFWLGFITEDFVSYDYFPLMPYIFMFLLGVWMGRWLKHLRETGSDNRLLMSKAPGVLTWPGRHSLWIYLLHQPILWGVCLMVYLFG